MCQRWEREVKQAGTRLAICPRYFWAIDFHPVVRALQIPRGVMSSGRLLASKSTLRLHLQRDFVRISKGGVGANITVHSRFVSQAGRYRCQFTSAATVGTGPCLEAFYLLGRSEGTDHIMIRMAMTAGIDDCEKKNKRLWSCAALDL